MFRRAAAIGLALALAGCTDKVVLQDMPNPTDSGTDSRDAWSGYDAGCLEPRTATYKPNAAQLLILLDRSAEMQRQFPGGGTKELAAQNALTNLLPTYETRIKFGFRDFPADPMKFQCSPGTCCVNPVNVERPNFNLAAAISSDILCNDPHHPCPTQSPADSPSNAALAQVRDDYKYPSTEDDVYVLLVTSSEPSCSADSHDPCASARIAAGSLGDMSIRIIVLSVGNQPDQGSSCLYQIAERGFHDPSDGIQLVYPVTNSDDLKNAVADVFSAVAKHACTCTLSSTSMVPPSGVLPTVYIGQTAIPPSDGQDGWSYDTFSRTRITFSGSACKTWLGSGAPLTTPDFIYQCSVCGGPNACYPTQWP